MICAIVCANGRSLSLGTGSSFASEEITMTEPEGAEVEETAADEAAEEAAEDGAAGESGAGAEAAAEVDEA